MKGDKGDISRGEKLFRKISQGDKFKKEIVKIRNSFGISTKDFSHSPYEPLVGTWEKSDLFKKEIDAILKRSALPINTWWQRRLVTFVLSDDKQDFLSPLYDFETPFIEIVTHHVGRDGSYNDVRLYEGVAQSDVKEFMARNWKYMLPSYREGTAQKIRGQKSEDIKIMMEAERLMRKSRIELGIPKDLGTTKEIEIAKILYKRYGKKITDDALKARLHRTKKRQR